MFIVGGSFCSLLASLVLFLSGRRQVPANRLLGLLLVVMAGFTFHFLLSPPLLRMAYPFSCLAAPLAYGYVRRVLLPDAGLRKQDWLHVMAAGIGLLEVSAVRMGVAPAFGLLALPAGGQLPLLSVLVFLPAQALCYLVLQGRLLLRYLSSTAAGARHTGKGSAAWPVVFVSAQTLVSSCLALAAFLPVAGQVPAVFLISAGLLAISAYLLCHPEILYGAAFRPAVPAQPAAAWADRPLPAAQPAAPHIARPVMEVAESAVAEAAAAHVQPMPGELAEAEIASERTLLVSPEQVAFYAGELKNYLAGSQVFRRQGISINEVAVALRVPARQLSYVINQHFHQRFNDLINSYRVDYIIDRLQKDDWRALTLEGLATQAGFSSRSTFFTAFKKVTSLNPTQFLQQLSKMAG